MLHGILLCKVRGGIQAHGEHQIDFLGHSSISLQVGVIEELLDKVPERDWGAK